ncbi:MAG: hypothetical protein EBZ03_02510 [Betaproteobacteria bacterium]|nr:hypothetical protein [Betaproteobacteria bacterium]NBO43577.1 hypothetical protein [Betaproteobacteria bacterium]NBP11394.1 hypothetical protein [Betaproteobacteria bacterium]NBP62203.1 hypothetical protein [Betaproteobacteria bacterium]NBQ08653.1 hypothetical protein [Betaproteobacteria bacterium]
MTSAFKFFAVVGFCAITGLGLNACSSSDGVTQGDIDAFKASYSSSLAGLSTQAVLTGSALQDLFDAKFLDSGFSRADIVAALNGEASAIQSAGGYSSVPQVTLANASVTDCVGTTQGDLICTLSGTLSNQDADVTSVQFTTQLRMADGKLRLYGDQLTAFN